MIGYGSLISWLLVVGKPASPAADIQPWVMPLAYVAAIVFIIILLAAVYLIILAVKQRHSENEG